MKTMPDRCINVIDRQGHRYKVAIRLEDGDICLFAHDARDGTRAGRVNALRLEDGNLLLADVLIEEAALPRPCQLWQRALAWMGWWRPKPVNYQRRGLGSRLLDLFLAEADRQEVNCVRGSLVQGDLIRWAGLADWYRSRGFQVLPAPQPWTVRGAVHGVERQRQNVETVMLNCTPG